MIVSPRLHSTIYFTIIATIAYALIYVNLFLAAFRDNITDMDKQQKLEYQGRIEDYLTREHVYDLFEELLQQLVVKQPEDPISFLIDRLATPTST